MIKRDDNLIDWPPRHVKVRRFYSNVAGRKVVYSEFEPDSESQTFRDNHSKDICVTIFGFQTGYFFNRGLEKIPEQSRQTISRELRTEYARKKKKLPNRTYFVN